MRAKRPSKLLKRNILVSVPEFSEEEVGILGRDPNDENNKYIIEEVSEEVAEAGILKVGDEVVLPEHARGLVLTTEEGKFILFRDADVEAIW